MIPVPYVGLLSHFWTTIFVPLGDIVSPVEWEARHLRQSSNAVMRFVLNAFCDAEMIMIARNVPRATPRCLYSTN